MKRYIQKIIVCMIALAMIMGNFAGMGVPVVKATDEEQTILNVIVKDEKGVGISGVKLCLKFDGSSSGMGSGGKSVKAGKTLKVKATVKTTGKNANKTLKWTSSNTKYATVSAKGVVKAKKAGKDKTVKITAAATDGSNKKKTITIKIK